MRAATRADALASNTGITDGSENWIWRGHARTVIETTLHAPALTPLFGLFRERDARAAACAA